MSELSEAKVLAQALSDRLARLDRTGYLWTSEERQGYELAGCVLALREAPKWQPIETAPKDGTKIDLWAKAWLPAFDRFEFRRFADCVWMTGDSMCNIKPYWLGLDKGWFPIYWMPLPDPPEVQS